MHPAAAFGSAGWGRAPRHAAAPAKAQLLRPACPACALPRSPSPAAALPTPEPGTAALAPRPRCWGCSAIYIFLSIFLEACAMPMAPPGREGAGLEEQGKGVEGREAARSLRLLAATRAHEPCMPCDRAGACACQGGTAGGWLPATGAACGCKRVSARRPPPALPPPPPHLPGHVQVCDSSSWQAGQRVRAVLAHATATPAPPLCAWWLLSVLGLCAWWLQTQAAAHQCRGGSAQMRSLLWLRLCAWLVLLLGGNGEPNRPPNQQLPLTSFSGRQQQQETVIMIGNTHTWLLRPRGRFCAPLIF
jgi:hypothetical protein